MAGAGAEAAAGRPPPLAVEVQVPCGRWTDDLPDAPALARRAAAAAWAVARPADAPAAEASVVLGDDALLRRLNADWRGIDAPTNVLAFEGGAAVAPGVAAPALIGDVVVAYETARREAEEAGVALADHLAHLVVHGVCHLLGYDHGNDAEAARMERLEARALAGLGVADPYASPAT